MSFRKRFVFVVRWFKRRQRRTKSDGRHQTRKRKDIEAWSARKPLLCADYVDYRWQVLTRKGPRYSVGHQARIWKYNNQTHLKKNNENCRPIYDSDNFVAIKLPITSRHTEKSTDDVLKSELIIEQDCMCKQLSSDHQTYNRRKPPNQRIFSRQKREKCGKYKLLDESDSIPTENDVQLRGHDCHVNDNHSNYIAHKNMLAKQKLNSAKRAKIRRSRRHGDRGEGGKYERLQEESEELEDVNRCLATMIDESCKSSCDRHANKISLVLSPSMDDAILGISTINLQTST